MLRRPLVIVLAAALLLPRIARLLYPQVWIEDEAYLNTAFMLSRGMVPYRDFPLPHLPLLEALMAAVFQVTNVTIRTAEVVTALAAFGGSLLVWAVGRRIGGTLMGSVAALVFALSPLLFRYHVFEREVFLVVPVLGAVLLLLGGSEAPPLHGESEVPRRHAAVAAGVLLAVALAIKLTAVSALAGTLAWLWLSHRRADAVRVGAVALGVTLVLALALVAAFGTPFLVQVVGFRAAHASFPSIGMKLDEARHTLDLALALAIGGGALAAWRRAWEANRLALAQLASGLVFLVLLNPAYWAHTGIELLPWLALLAGYLVASLFEPAATATTTVPAAARAAGTAAARARGRTGDAARRPAAAPDQPPSHSAVPAFVCIALAVTLLVTVVPVDNINWRAGDARTPMAFGYRDRAELDQAAAWVREHSAPDARVAVPGIIAFAANRVEAVPYAEVAGTMDELAESVRTRGWMATLTASGFRDRTFWESVEASRDRMRPGLADQLTALRIPVVINDSPEDLVPVPFVDFETGDLRMVGYQPGLATAHYQAFFAEAHR